MKAGKHSIILLAVLITFKNFPHPALSEDTDVAVNVEGRIIGGVPLLPHALPYLVELKVRPIPGSPEYIHRCGGVLIAADVVITVDRCVNNFLPLKYAVVAGQHDLEVEEGTEQLRDVINVTQIPSNVPKSNVKLALLQMIPFELNKNVGLAKLVVGPCELPDVVNVAGWGYSSSQETNVTRLPHILGVKVVPNDKCSKQLEFVVTNDLFCAGGEGKGICHGDPGDPVMDNDVVVGLAYRSASQCNALIPNAHLRLDMFSDGIRDQLCKWDPSECPIDYDCSDVKTVRQGIASTIMNSMCAQVEKWRATKEIQPPLKSGPSDVECPHYTWHKPGKGYGCHQNECPYDYS